jgi:hypothetical protein
VGGIFRPAAGGSTILKGGPVGRSGGGPGELGDAWRRHGVERGGPGVAGNAGDTGARS